MIRLIEDTIGWRSHKQRIKSTSTCQAETIAISDVCAELVLLDRGIKDMIGMSMYPVNVRSDNRSAVNCTQMDGCNKLKTFNAVEEIQRNLAVREQTRKKVPMSREHGNYVKICT